MGNTNMKQLRFTKSPFVKNPAYAYYEQKFTTTVGNINNVEILITWNNYSGDHARVQLVKKANWHIGWTKLSFLTQEVTKFLKGETPMPKHIEAYLVKEVESSEYFQRASKKKAQHVNSKKVRQEWTASHE